MNRTARKVLVSFVCVGVLIPATIATAAGFPTIDGLFSGIGPIGPGTVLNLTVTGRGGVPATGVDAVAINVTATAPVASSFLTIYPAGAQRPTASNLNFAAGQTIPNMVIAKVGTNGQISIFNLAGTVEVVVDVLGWFPTGGSYTGLSPARLLETRPNLATVDGQLNGIGPVGPNGVLALPILGRGGVPANGVDAVALNVTAAGGTAPSFLTVWPGGPDRPTASNLNFVAGDTVPNMVIAKVGPDGQILIFNLAGSVDVVVDVLGWFPTGGSYTGLSPARLLETRASLATIDGQFNGIGSMTTGATIDFAATGRAGVPFSGVDAVALNVTATGPTASTFLTVWPTGTQRPNASNLNVVARQTIPNMVIAKVGADGQISIFNLAGNVDVVVDVLGWFPSGGSYTGLSPARLMDTRVVPEPPPPPPPPPPQVLTFAPGTYQVNVTMPPGRYVAETAHSGCYWERLNGFGGSLGEINANDFQNFTGRVLVDILPSDVGFDFDDGCGLFKSYVPSGALATTIFPGNHVVGQHIVAGTYSTNALDGCYWQRSRSFDGSIGAIIANDFVSPGAPILVTISTSDVGFYTDADCGIWTRL
jgi:hypothetical protein